MDSTRSYQPPRIQVSYIHALLNDFEHLKFKHFSFHLNYRKDSIVTERINYDLLKKAKEIQEGTRSCEELLGHCTQSKTKDDIPSAIQKHLSGKC